MNIESFVGPMLVACAVVVVLIAVALTVVLTVEG